MGLTVGLGLYTGQRPGRSYRDVLVLARAAEEAGFDAFWVSEHHGLDDDYLPAPLTALAAAAAVTDRILLGTGLLLAPLRHPVALAEEAAVVDQLCEGRLVLGLGLGYLSSEYAALGVDRRRRGVLLDEAVTVLRRAWTGARFTHHGAGWRFEDVRVTPRPWGGRDLPVWLGGYAEPAVRRARRVADGHLVGRGDLPLVEQAAALLGEERSPGPNDPFTVGVNLITVLDAPDGHPGAALEALTRQQLSYEQLQRTDDPYGGKVAVGAADAALALGAVDRYVHLRGDPQAITAAVTRYRAALAPWSNVHLVLRALFPEPHLDRQVERLGALGRDVLPTLRAAW